MKAYVCRRYGGPEVLELVDIDKPVPKDNEILVRIAATTVTSGDRRVRSLQFPRGFALIGRLALGINKPRQPILGTEFAGTVESVGGQVTRFKPGDAVFGFPGGKMRCYAEYRTIAEDGPVAAKPATLSMEEAACLCFGGSTALHFLRKGRLQAGERMLVIGASGNVGSSLVQLARQQGAKVTGVTSTANVELVASLGAERIIDYSREDYAAANAGAAYEVIADAVGAASFARVKHLLVQGGRFLAVSGDLMELFGAMRPHGAGKRVIAGPAEERADDVPQLASLAEAGAFRPIIDRRFRFADMAAAHAYGDTGRKRGSIVVTVDH